MLRYTYYSFFSRIIYLMTYKKKYNFGMAVVLFSYLLSLYVLPFVFVLLMFFNMPAMASSLSVMGAFALICWYNYSKTKNIHREVYLSNYERKDSRFSILKYFVFGFVFFMVALIFISRFLQV